MMDNLQGLLRTLSSDHAATSADGETQSPHHLDVFREFLAHLERARRRPAARPRAKAMRKAVQAGKR